MTSEYAQGNAPQAVLLFRISAVFIVLKIDNNIKTIILQPRLYLSWLFLIMQLYHQLHNKSFFDIKIINDLQKVNIMHTVNGFVQNIY